MKRLCNDVICARCKPIYSPSAIALASDEDDRSILERGVVSDPPGKLDAADRTHSKLGKHQIYGQAEHFGGGITGILASDNPIARLYKPLRKHAERIAVGFDDQHASGAIRVI